MKKTLICLLICCVLVNCVLGKEYTVESPDKKIRAVISVDKDIRYRLAFKNKSYLLPSVISMTLGDGKVLGTNPVIRKNSIRAVTNVIRPLYGINNEIIENYNELRLDFKGNYTVVFRVYDQGFAWRFVTKIPGDIIVRSERTDFQFADNYTAYFHPLLSEAFYRVQKISDFKNKPNYTSLPLLIKATDNINILVHESDVLNYPCLTLSSDAVQTGLLTGSHSFYPKIVEPGGYNSFNLVVKENEEFIAKTSGTRDFPWRIVAFEEADKDILGNQLVYLLASESRITETSWIRPGKVAWDWWNAQNLTGVPFKTGFNTETYKYFIDFAAENGIEYVNLDDGWSHSFDLLKTTDKINMAELVQYAKSKNVGLILWCVWWTLDKQMTAALDQFEKWGIAGLKVDFMDRDDQVVVEFQERLLKEAGKRKMLVNYHGAYHPTGMDRTYPNNINVEGVRGLEWNKFNPEGTTPDHDVTIPFIRMFAGGMDYTPGAMSNYNRNDWKQISDRPVSQGTRCHQLAMYIVYYGALQMLSDAPTAYQAEPGFLGFLADIPTVWDRSIPLESSVGEYVSIARRKGTSWYVGAMTNWNARKLEISLDFLEEGKTYEAEVFMDGVNADRVGSDYQTIRKPVNKGDNLIIDMASGGGFAAKFTVK